MDPRIREDDKGQGALRRVRLAHRWQAQGPGYGGSRPSFPRRRESIETKSKEWIPAFARMTKGRGPFDGFGWLTAGKLRCRVTEALARHSRVGGNP